MFCLTWIRFAIILVFDYFCGRRKVVVMVEVLVGFVPVADFAEEGVGRKDS